MSDFCTDVTVLRCLIKTLMNQTKLSLFQLLVQLVSPILSAFVWVAVCLVLWNKWQYFYSDKELSDILIYSSVPQLPDRGLVPGPDINYTGPRESWGNYNKLQDFISPVDNKFKCNFIFVNMPHLIHKCTNILYDYAIINY